MGRNAQPTEILKLKGKSHHITKAEEERRDKASIKFGDKKLVCPAYVKNDTEAYKKWLEVTKLYKDVDFVTSGDNGMLARYCKTYSEYQVLLKSHQRVSDIHYDCDELEEIIEDTNDEGKVLYSAKVKKQLRDLFSISAILSIESAINKKMDMLIKMEDRMFLNPLAKIKNIPKKEKEEVDPDADLFE
jgi:phage terminase small subunit